MSPALLKIEGSSKGVNFSFGDEGEIASSPLPNVGEVESVMHAAAEYSGSGPLPPIVGDAAERLLPNELENRLSRWASVESEERTLCILCGNDLLAPLPWEAMVRQRFAEIRDLFVARVLTEEKGAGKPVGAVREASMVLAGWARLEGSPFPGIERELREVRDRLRGGRIGVQALGSPTANQLKHACGDYKPQIVHLSSPGISDWWVTAAMAMAADATKKKGRRSKGDEAATGDGAPIDMVPAAQVAAFLKGSPNLALVVLNTCHSGLGASREIVKACNAVCVGWAGYVQDDIAADFATYFYQRLVEGYSVIGAVRSFVNLGRQGAGREVIAAPSVWLPSPAWVGWKPLANRSERPLMQVSTATTIPSSPLIDQEYIKASKKTPTKKGLVDEGYGGGTGRKASKSSSTYKDIGPIGNIDVGNLDVAKFGGGKTGVGKITIGKIDIEEFGIPDPEKILAFSEQVVVGPKSAPKVSASVDVHIPPATGPSPANGAEAGAAIGSGGEACGVISPAVEIELKLREAINPALLLNGNSPIQHLSFGCDREVKLVRIEIECDAGGNVSTYCRTMRLREGPNPITDLENIAFPALFDLAWRDSPRRMVNFTVRVSRGFGMNAEVLGEKTLSVQWMARNEWLDRGELWAFIPAFVQPNARGVRKVLDDAVRMLRFIDGPEAAFDGYQAADDARVGNQVKAIFQTLRDEPFSITYINPLAGPVYEGSGRTPAGQLVRFPDEIIEHKRGTCHDLALLFASCLEHVGIRPMIVLVRGHTFIGYWRRAKNHADYWQRMRFESGRAEPTARMGLLTKLARFKDCVGGSQADSRIEFFECTLATDRKATYEDSIEVAWGRVRELRADMFHAAIDVCVARAQVQPL